MCLTTCWKPYTGSLSVSALRTGSPPWCGDVSWALPHPICGTSVVPYRAPRVLAPFAPLGGGAHSPVCPHSYYAKSCFLSGGPDRLEWAALGIAPASKNAL